MPASTTTSPCPGMVALVLSMLLLATKAAASSAKVASMRLTDDDSPPGEEPHLRRLQASFPHAGAWVLHGNQTDGSGVCVTSSTATRDPVDDETRTAQCCDGSACRQRATSGGGSSSSNDDCIAGLLDSAVDVTTYEEAFHRCQHGSLASKKLANSGRPAQRRLRLNGVEHSPATSTEVWPVCALSAWAWASRFIQFRGR